MESKEALARAAGLRDFATPELEDVDRRRSQLWLLSLLVGLALPAIIVALGFDVLPPGLMELLDLRSVRLVLVALLVAVFGYVAERERTLRSLTGMLVEERVLTASLVARVSELDLMLAASRAMNSSLQLDITLGVILKSASQLLEASEGAIQLVRPSSPDELEVVAVHGDSSARQGQRQSIGEGLAGQVAKSREALLVTGRHPGSRVTRSIGSALVVPLITRGRLVGVLDLSAGVEQPPFTEFQLRSVSVFAETAAAAIANARLHEESEASVASLTELDRMKDEFLTLVTHELRTPLTAVIGLAQTIERSEHRLPRSQIAEIARLIATQGWRLDRLVEDLLRTSQLQGGLAALCPEPVDVAALVREAVSAMQAGSGTHALSLCAPDGPLVRTVDSHAVHRIVVNLVGNALKYTEAGTRVTVAVAADGDDALRLTVEDDGTGIPEQQWGRVFDRFRRGEGLASGGGMGLGLYLVRALAEAHGGNASVERSPRGGCRFTITVREVPPGEGAGADPCQSVSGLNSRLTEFMQ